MKTGIECISCNYTMTGIFGYTIRRVCSLCGGFSLVAGRREDQKAIIAGNIIKGGLR